MRADAAGGGGAPRAALLALLAAALAVALAGSAWIARDAVARRHAAFETDARIVHRVLSQRLVQHDAILGTLALLQPGGAADGGGPGPEQRLTALIPQVQRVLRRENGEPWSTDGVLDAALREAEAASRQQQRAVAAAVALEAAAGGGRYWLVRAATPASFALLIDVRELVAGAAAGGEWPLAASAPGGAALRATLHHAGQRALLAPAGPVAATSPAAEPPRWPYAFAKALAAESQPFELRIEGGSGWRDLPWLAMAAWCALVTALAAAGAFAWRARAEQRRSRELLRLGRVGRLNALGELAAGIAHELNQPLTAVVASSGAAQRLLADAEPDLPTARQAMRQAAEQARRAAEVVARLRRLIERPAADRGAVAAVPLAPLLNGALDLYRAELRRLGVRADVTCEPADCAVLAEPVALEQIVHNLIANALHALTEADAAERELRLAVQADAASGRVRLVVRDTGPGIAPEVLPRLFEPFVTTREGGLGLGLSLSETLAAGMGGSLSAANVTAPRGAAFTLELPIATEPGPARTAEAAS